jgi:aspartyl-tRNA(Asn)/glutamyl-tRNA(Gln) amidotransferase subunit B
VVDQVATVVDLGLDPLVVAAAASGVAPGLALARTANEAANDAEAARRLDVESYVALLSLEADGSLTATQSKAVLAEMLAHGGEPAAIAAAKGFEAMSEDSLVSAVADTISAFPDEWARFCEGDERVGGALIGKVMHATHGQADGKAVRAELARRRG